MERPFRWAGISWRVEKRRNNPTKLQSFGDSALCQLSSSLVSKTIPFAEMFFPKEAGRAALLGVLSVGGLWFLPKQVGVAVDGSVFSSMMNRATFSELDSSYREQIAAWKWHANVYVTVYLKYRAWGFSKENVLLSWKCVQMCASVLRAFLEKPHGCELCCKKHPSFFICGLSKLCIIYLQIPLLHLFSSFIHSSHFVQENRFVCFMLQFVSCFHAGRRFKAV